jgi:hypothetical protein
MKNRVGFADVGLNRERPVVGGQQRTGVREHDRVVVHIRDPCLRVHLLGDLVRGPHRRDARTDVQELGDALTCRVGDDPAQELAVRRHLGAGRRHRHHDLLRGVAVHLEIVLPAEQEVIDPRRMGCRRVDPGKRETFKVGRVVRGEGTI